MGTVSAGWSGFAEVIDTTKLFKPARGLWMRMNPGSLPAQLHVPQGLPRCKQRCVLPPEHWNRLPRQPLTLLWLPGPLRALGSAEEEADLLFCFSQLAQPGCRLPPRLCFTSVISKPS